MGTVEAGAPVGVVGAGTMGAGIALVAAQAGHPVLLLDARAGAADDAVRSLREKLTRLGARGKVDPDDAAAAGERLQVASAVADLAGCRLVVEAVVEDLAVKRDLFAGLEQVVADDALLATNTSSISVTAVAARLARPERVVGLHFFNPADRMRLVEVVRGDATSDAVVETAVELARAWGKTPVVCTSTPGFIVNRVARPYYGEAQRMVEEGVADPATIDAVLREAGGFPLGPFELTDLVGQDVNLAVSRSVWEQTFHDPRYAPTVFQQRLVDAGRLGRKTGQGVYRYADGKAVDAEPSTEPPRPAPQSVVVHRFSDEPPFGPMEAFLDRIRAAVSVTTIELDDDEDPFARPGVALPGGVVLQATDGSTAAEAADEEAVVLLDWAFDPATCTRVALTPSPECPETALHAAVGLCQATGASVSVLRDGFGAGPVARTVSMLVNEAADVVLRGEATADDVDTAMALGTGYPIGPLAWGDRIGTPVEDVLDSLDHSVGTGRYRMSRAFQLGLLREL
ncbi:3-hydroxyacyl-CoA dehydrogenase [Angustibacter aerolatus]